MKKQPTSNIEHPTPNDVGAHARRIGCSVLDVGCWMFFKQ
jgi:hypothetical protein